MSVYSGEIQISTKCEDDIIDITSNIQEIVKVSKGSINIIAYVSTFGHNLLGLQDDQPGDEIEIFASGSRCFCFRWQYSSAVRKKRCSGSFLECMLDGNQGLFDQAIVMTHVSTIVCLIIEQIAKPFESHRFASSEVTQEKHRFLRLSEAVTHCAIVMDVHEVIWRKWIKL